MSDEAASAVPRSITVKALSMLVVYCLVLCSTMLTRSTGAEISSTTIIPHASAATVPASFECGGEPCHAVQRGLRAFFDRTPGGTAGNGRACADCHVPTDSFQRAPATVEARVQVLQWRRRFCP